MDDSTPGEIRDDANAVIAWLRAHPKTVRAALWLVVGFALGLMAGCATYEKSIVRQCAAIAFSTEGSAEHAGFEILRTFGLGKPPDDGL